VTISFQRSTKADLQIQTISDFRREKKSPFIHTQTKLGWKRGEKSQLTIAVQCPDKPRQRTAQQQPNPIQTVETLFQEKNHRGGERTGLVQPFDPRKPPNRTCQTMKRLNDEKL
jgi:hypothetical protein